MVGTKCADYNVAILYLKGSDYNLELAIEAFKADEQWEKDHPMKGNGKEKIGRRPEMRSMSFGMSGQLT
jgi:hypothetical protein